MSSVNRPLSKTRRLETKEALFRTRKRILKYLVVGFLKQEGYHHTANTFVSEADVTEEYQLCDNIDLEIILQDYCSYYLIRFNKQPQFCRKVEEQQLVRRPQTRPARPRVMLPDRDPQPDLPSTFTVTQLLKDIPENLEGSIPAIDRKPLAGFMANMPPDKRQLVELLYQDIIRPSGVRWDDVKGLESAKNILMESVVYPVRHPELFMGVLEPWRGVLLHGPPGTGKTLLARAAADHTSCTFFNVPCSTLVSKWRGDSEKIVKVLFEMASYYSPSIIFIDEVEAIASTRSAPGEHEASRRLKSQLLTELDGVSTREGLIFLLASSNMPWEIDPAMLRRLEKRIHIGLPDKSTRKQLFTTFLGAYIATLDIEVLAECTDGYSASEIKLVCKEALMALVRNTLPDNASRQSGRKECLEMADVLRAIEKTKPISKKLAKRHAAWQETMGCC